MNFKKCFSISFARKINRPAAGSSVDEKGMINKPEKNGIPDNTIRLA